MAEDDAEIEVEPESEDLNLLLSKQENVRVVARFRPINEREKEEWKKSSSKYDNEPEVPVEVLDKTIVIQNNTDRPFRFTFDDVLWTDISQERAFEHVALLSCRNALSGFNSTIFAYGQTGSGKTHTMLGPEDKFDPSLSGIVPRASNFFFHALENSPEVEQCELKVSFLEEYRGELRDLNPDVNKNIDSLKIRQKVNGETYVEGLNTVNVDSLPEVLKLIQVANRNRTMAATSMNKTSSRSHSIMTFYLRIKRTQAAGGHKLYSKVNFIDLAGSEKVKKTGAEGQRLKEAQSINIGLSTLARVIEALVKGKRSIPFRDSLLTWLLKDSLIGNTKTTLMVALSPHIFNREETISSCRFASRCKLIKTRVVSNKELTPSQMKALIKKLRAENGKLRDQIVLAGPLNDAPLISSEKKSGMEDELWNYKLQAESRQKQIEKYKEQLKENEKNKEEMQLQIEELQAVQLAHEDCEQTINTLEIEIGRLKKELEQSQKEKQQLAVTNILLAEKLSASDLKLSSTRQDVLNKQLLVDLSSEQTGKLEKEKKSLINDLKDLKFSNEEATKIYENVLNEMRDITNTFNETNQELQKLTDRNNELESSLENKEFEIKKLTQENEKLKEQRKTLKELASSSNEQDDDNEVKDPNEPQKLHATSFTLKRENQLIDDQMKYLQQMAEKEQSEFLKKQDAAWKKFLEEKAKELGHKNSKELLKERRANAKKDLKDGKIDAMPTDDELLSDIREEFLLKYDPVTGEFRSLEEKETEMMGIAPHDEEEVDDPWLWDKEEVSKWVGNVVNLSQYSKQFVNENIDGRILLSDLTVNNLKQDLNIKDVHCDKIMRFIKDLRERSPGYEEWLREHEEKGGDGNAIVIKKQNNIDDEEDVNGDIGLFELTEEEKNFGEQFWALDELFKILDVRETGTLDIAAFKHGLHALNVDLTDEEMGLIFEQINSSHSGEIGYQEFIRYLQFTDVLPAQQRKNISSIISSIPRVATNRRAYVTRAAMVIKYAVKFNNNKSDINNYLLNKGLTRAEIDAAWKQYLFNEKAIPDIEINNLQLLANKLIGQPNNNQKLQPFNDYNLFKLLKRAGHKTFGAKEFNDLDYLRAAGFDAKICNIKCWFDLKSEFFNGLQITYQCHNGQQLVAPKQFVNQGNFIEEDITLNAGEYILRLTVFFTHFISGILIDTNERSKLFGASNNKIMTILEAPNGAHICAFYGSKSRLFETLGCYVVKNDIVVKGNFKKQRLSKSSKNKSSHHAKTSSTGDQGGEESQAEVPDNSVSHEIENKTKKGFFSKIFK